MSHELAAFAKHLVSNSTESWDARALFAPPDLTTADQEIVAARMIADDCGVGDHDFFRIALTHPELLKLWASQEAIVTGPFSQLLLLLTSQIDNVHVRANFLEVASGEHNGVRDGQALLSHPWLLHRLCVSCGINLSNVHALPATVRFLARLAAEMVTLPRALGAFGVGNERMLLTEYAAVQKCFSKALPEVDYQPFLRANIAEDTIHSEIIEVVATNLAVDASWIDGYIEGAVNGVAARVDYYDDLINNWRELGFPAEWATSANATFCP